MSTILQREAHTRDDPGITVTEIDDPIGGSAFEGILQAYRHQGYVQGHEQASREALGRVRLAAAEFIRARDIDAGSRALLDALLVDLDRALATSASSHATFVGGLGI